MTNNEFLKALWEGMPGAWRRQVFLHKEWFGLSTIDQRWYENCTYRLIPVVPEGCEPPPEGSHAYGPDKPGAVCLQGPVKLPEGVVYFSGWCIDRDCEIDNWEHDDAYEGDEGCYSYLLDLTDPNASEILALNKPEWKLPGSEPTPEQRASKERDYPANSQLTPDQRAAMDKLVAEGQERGEYDTPDPLPNLVIPADVMENCNIEDLMRGALACGYSIKMVDGIIVGWRDE